MNASIVEASSPAKNREGARNPELPQNEKLVIDPIRSEAYVKGYGEVRYWGLAKNAQYPALRLGMGNLLAAGALLAA